MEMDIKSIQDGLLAFRNLDRDLLKKNNKILRESYGKEAYYFKMDGLEFVTYGKETSEHILSDDFEKYFEEQFDNEFVLDIRNYKPYINPSFSYRLLTEGDSELLVEFKKEFSESDLDHGAVSIEDPVVVGAFDGEKLVAVSSMWEWENDLDHGAVSIEDPVVVGAFDGEKLVAVSSMWEWENDLDDIGLIVSNKYRKRGLGKSVVSVIINEVRSKKICIYRADYDNPGSVRIAEALGFKRITRIYRYKG